MKRIATLLMLMASVSAIFAQRTRSMHKEMLQSFTAEETIGAHNDNRQDIKVVMQEMEEETIVDIYGARIGEAYYYMDEGNTYWDFNFFAAVKKTGELVKPQIYFSSYTKATSKTSIVGEWKCFFADYVAAVGDTIWSDIDDYNSSIKLVSVAENYYNVYGSFIGEDGKRYRWTMYCVEMYAYDLTDGDKKITMAENYTPETIDLYSFNSITQVYYPSSNKDGKYNYSLNCTTDGDYPVLILDTYSSSQTDLSGSYSNQLGNVGEYSYYFMSNKDEKTTLSNLEYTVTTNGETMTIVGKWKDKCNNTFQFGVEGKVQKEDGEYPYEPMDKQADINLSISNIDIDTDYLSQDELIYHLTTQDGNELVLGYYTWDKVKTIPDGNYIFKYMNPDSFLPGAHFTYMGLSAFDGSYYIDYQNAAYYYLISGTVVVSTRDGEPQVAVDATSAHGTHIVATMANNTAIDVVGADNNTAEKMIQNGRFLVRKGNKTYDLVGSIIE